MTKTTALKNIEDKIQEGSWKLRFSLAKRNIVTFDG
jgi:hypothetical protein